MKSGSFDHPSEATIAFTSLLWIWRSDAAGSWYFATVPDEQSAEIKAQSLELPRGFGSVRVQATLGTVTWRTSVFPLNKGGYLLPIKAEVRKRAGLLVGDELQVSLKLI